MKTINLQFLSKFLFSMLFFLALSFNSYGQCNKITVYEFVDIVPADALGCVNGMANFLLFANVSITGGMPSVALQYTDDNGDIINAVLFVSGDNITQSVGTLFSAPCDADFLFAPWTNPTGGGSNCGTCGPNNNPFPCPPMDFSSPLPVEFISLKARTQKASIFINWVTASEENNDFFEIERSTDGRNFLAIDQVKGNGTIDVNQYYEFEDIKPRKGINYYRLRQVDYDGSFYYSDVISAQSDVGDIMVKVVPTHAMDRLSVVFYEVYKEDAPLEVFDLLGNKVLEGYLREGSNEVKFDISDLTSGNYFIRLRGEREFITKRFIKIE